MSEQEQSNNAQSQDQQSLVDELGVQDLRELIFSKRGKLFSAAGRDAPVAELSKDWLVLHPSQKPLVEGESGEEIVMRTTDQGILLDELGNVKRLSGAKYNGQSIYVLGETLAGTTKNLVAWQDKDGKLHKLLLDDEPLTVPAAYKLRNKTHNGEINIFENLASE